MHVCDVYVCVCLLEKIVLPCYLVEPGDVEQQQPRLSQAAGFSLFSSNSAMCQWFVVFWLDTQLSCGKELFWPVTCVNTVVNQWCSVLESKFIIFWNHELQNFSSLESIRNTQLDLSKVHLAQHSAFNRANRTYCLRTAHKPGRFLQSSSLVLSIGTGLGKSASSP